MGIRYEQPPGRTFGTGGAPRPPALDGDPDEYDAWMRANPVPGGPGNPLMGAGNPFLMGQPGVPGGQYGQIMNNMGGGADPMAGGEGPGGIRGWWGGLEGMEKAQIIAAVLQGGLGAYAGHQQGKRIDEDRKRAEEQRQRDEQERKTRAEILGPLLAQMGGR